MGALTGLSLRSPITDKGNSMTFKEDIIVGKDAELLVQSIQHRCGWPETELNTGPNLKAYDLRNRDFLSEVKIDLMSEKTGNIFFEQSYRGEPSGFEATESHLWFEVIPNEGVFAFSTKHLKEHIRRDYHTHGTQRPHCGDGGMSSVVTFKKEWVKELFWCIAEPDGVYDFDWAREVMTWFRGLV